MAQKDTKQSRQPDQTLDPKKMKENRNIILNQTRTEMIIIMHELSASTVLCHLVKVHPSGIIVTLYFDVG